MKKTNFKIVALMLAMITVLVFCMTACSGGGEPDGAQGEYLFEWEKLAVITRTDYDYKFILDGHGGGEYHHKGSVHKIKYEYQTSGDINIKDTITGIKYNGTLINGELHIYDGDPNSDMVSEFMYKKQ